MTEEEKNAIETLIEIKEFSKLSSYLDVKAKQLNAINIVLNLIGKQGKEIEELKKYKQYYETEKVIWKRGSNSISKDKIRAKIEELKQKEYILSSKDSEIEILLELLEE